VNIIFQNRFLSLYIKLCQKIKIEISYFKKIFDYNDELIKDIFKLNKSQTIIGSILLIIPYFIILNVFIKIFNIPNSWLFLGVGIGFLLLWRLFKFLPNHIKKMEEKSLSYFEILILELKIISRTIEKTKAREIEIINIIFEGPKIAWNQKEIYQKILLGSDIKSNLNEMPYKGGRNFYFLLNQDFHSEPSVDKEKFKEFIIAYFDLKS